MGQISHKGEKKNYKDSAQEKKRFSFKQEQKKIADSWLGSSIFLLNHLHLVIAFFFFLHSKDNMYFKKGCFIYIFSHSIHTKSYVVCSTLPFCILIFQKKVSSIKLVLFFLVKTQICIHNLLGNRRYLKHIWHDIFTMS